MMKRTKSTKEGWEKIGRKHYRHVTGVELRYDCNRYGWEVIGGPLCGTLYGNRLWVAMHFVASTPAAWA